MLTPEKPVLPRVLTVFPATRGAVLPIGIDFEQGVYGVAECLMQGYY
jgi:hypothetical protein